MSTLNLTYDELRRHVGRFLGYNRDFDSWDADDAQDVTDIIRAGLREFYWPYFGENVYVWSFLKTEGTITTAADTYEYNLPLDFHGILENPTFEVGSGHERISKAGDADIRSIKAVENETGVPQYYSIRTKPAQAGGPSARSILLHPTPDKAYSITLRYTHEPLELDASNEIHLGGAQNSKAVLEACLAQAEVLMNPEATNGLHVQAFQQAVMSAIMLDMEMQ